MAWKPLVLWNWTFFISKSIATCRREQLTKLLLIFNSIIMLVSEFAVGLEKVWRVPVYYRSKVIAHIFIQRKAFILLWTKFHLFLNEVSFGVEIVQFWGKMVVQEVSGSTLMLRISLFMPLSGFWNFWYIGFFEQLVVFLLQIFALLNKIDSEVVSVSYRVFFYKINLSAWVCSVRG